MCTHVLEMELQNNFTRTVLPEMDPINFIFLLDIDKSLEHRLLANSSSQISNPDQIQLIEESEPQIKTL